MSSNLKYLFTALAAFLVGFIYYSNRKKKPVDDSFNKTIARKSGEKYFLIFNSAVVLSREITKEQYDSFISQYPTGIAPSNVLSDFSTPPPRYTSENGRYFESTWDDTKYGQKIEITKAEYAYWSKENNEMSLISENYL